MLDRDMKDLIKACLSIIPEDVSYKSELKDAADKALIAIEKKQGDVEAQHLAFAAYFCGKLSELIPEEDVGKDWEVAVSKVIMGETNYEDYLRD